MHPEIVLKFYHKVNLYGYLWSMEGNLKYLWMGVLWLVRVAFIEFLFSRRCVVGTLQNKSTYTYTLPLLLGKKITPKSNAHLMIAFDFHTVSLKCIFYTAVEHCFRWSTVYRVLLYHNSQTLHYKRTYIMIRPWRP